MSQNYKFSVPDNKVGEIEAVKFACEKHGIQFSKLIVEAIINEFVSGKWSAFFRKQTVYDKEEKK